MIILWVAGILDSILETTTPRIADSSYSLARDRFQFCFHYRECMLFLYRAFYIVNLFLTEVSDSLF